MKRFNIIACVAILFMLLVAVSFALWGYNRIIFMVSNNVPFVEYVLFGIQFFSYFVMLMVMGYMILDTELTINKEEE